MSTPILAKEQLPPPNEIVNVSLLKKEKLNTFGEPMYLKWMTKGFIDELGNWFFITEYKDGTYEVGGKLEDKPWRWCKLKDFTRVPRGLMRGRLSRQDTRL